MPYLSAFKWGTKGPINVVTSQAKAPPCYCCLKSAPFPGNLINVKQKPKLSLFMGSQ